MNNFVTEVWMLRTLRFVYVAFIAAASGVAIRASLHGAGEAGHGTRVVLILALVELIAALAFLVDRIEVAACTLLILTYATAAISSVESADFLAPLRFAYFAATAIYLVKARRRLHDGSHFNVAR